TEHQPWIASLSLNYSLGVDGISLFLMILTALLATVSIGVTPLLMKNLQQPRLYYALMLLLTTGIQGVFLSTNVFLFYVFWEIMLIPAYLLIGTFGGTNRSYAAIKFVIYTAIGSLLMLAGVVGLTAIGTAGGSLDLNALVGHVPANTQMLFFLAFFAAFAIKSPLFPFHSWLPDAYAEAPIPVTVMLAGAMSKTGTYGILRYCMTLFPQAVKDATPVIGSLAVAGILYCAVQAVTQQDFKRLLGYSSISHIGVVLLGLFAFNQQGIDGAVLQMVNHGITTAALFLIAGFIEVRFKNRTLREYGGLAARLPILATVFAIATLSSLGLPGLNSFAGEFLALLGAFRANIAFGVLGTLVVIPAAWYLLRFFQGVMEGPLPPKAPADATTPVAAQPRPAQHGRSFCRAEPRPCKIDPQRRLARGQITRHQRSASAFKRGMALGARRFANACQGQPQQPTIMRQKRFKHLAHFAGKAADASSLNYGLRQICRERRFAYQMSNQAWAGLVGRSKQD
ncbi:MAG: NADH-quinone oxidoreductase subunit M, partial [Acidocella sp.]|nr:NADH-quinone oxidoreductase subunit M [Acidocella sp.]